MKNAWIRSAFAAGLLALPLSGCVVVIGGSSKYDDFEDSNVAVDSKARMGITMERVDPPLAAQLGVDREKSTLVTQVLLGWPADRAGVKRFDVITSCDGNDAAAPDDLRHMIHKKKPGDEIHLTVVRNAQVVEVCVHLDGKHAEEKTSD
jgi:S1-C subfamily serine protease